MESLRIATWPVNGINTRLPYLAHWLDSRKPDFVALQKIRGSVETFPANKLSSIGYCSVVFPPSFHYDFGVAILVRKPSSRPKVLERGLRNQQHYGARLLTVEVGDLIFSSVYVPAEPRRKIAWLHDFTRYVCRDLDAAKRIVFCGDFNVDEKPVTKRARQLLESLAESGYKDLYRCLHPHRYGFNFGKSRDGPVTARLNRVLGTQEVVDDVRGVWVDLEYRGPILGLKDRGWTLSAPLIVDLDRRVRESV